MKLRTKLTIFLHLLLVLLWVIPSCGASDYTKNPLFLVHGYGMSAKSWQPLITYLKEKSGYPSQFLRAIQLVPNDDSNIHAAENQIKPAIEVFLKDVNEFLAQNHPNIPQKTKINLISHSMGGLSSRWYTAKVRPDRVRKWISLAGANHGTNDVCPLRFISPGADDLCPAYAKNEQESFVQYSLNGAPKVPDVDETPYGLGGDSTGVASIPPGENRRVLYITISTTDDEWIDPDDSVSLDGAGGLEIPIPPDLPAKIISSGNILMTNGVRHDSMLQDSDTMKLVGIILSID
jgi:pimeloyl-ACP methyl ester carboxylesterase